MRTVYLQHRGAPLRKRWGPAGLELVYGRSETSLGHKCLSHRENGWLLLRFRSPCRSRLGRGPLETELFVIALFGKRQGPPTNKPKTVGHPHGATPEGVTARTKNMACARLC